MISHNYKGNVALVVLSLINFIMSSYRKLPEILHFVFFITVIWLLNGCKEDPTLPDLTTGEASNVTVVSAIITGKVTSDGGAEITARGICWGIQAEPTLNDDYKASGIGTGEFTCTIEGLLPNTEYHARAYAENSVGIAYGNDITFVTGIAAPTVTTSAVTGITNTTAVCGGTVTYNGGAPILEKGMCWSTLPDPDLQDSHTNISTGNETFSSTMTNLLQGTRYYAKAYIKNSAGTAYGAQVTFITKIADTDGNLYGVVYIGNQVWMSENLKTTRLNDNTEIPNISDDTTWVYLSTPAYCWLRNDIQFKDTYGALYNWFTVETGKLCPSGWHVPTDNEFKILEQTLGMASDQLDLSEWRGTDQGAMMKSSTGWAEGENGNNSSGFSGLPGGYRWAKTGAFNGIGLITYWWSSDPIGDYAWYRRLDGTNNDIYRMYTSKRGGKYVRCVKD